MADDGQLSHRLKITDEQSSSSLEWLEYKIILVNFWTELGDTLCTIGVKESAAANEAFTKFGEYHRQMEKVGINMLKKTKRVSALNCTKVLIYTTT